MPEIRWGFLLQDQKLFLIRLICQGLSLAKSQAAAHLINVRPNGLMMLPCLIKEVNEPFFKQVIFILHGPMW
jgi:hypothetical protein